ncbi:MAG: hypothetical protein MRY64_01195 [Hyphomonadaceae bacterium]|nr:hypothetical protein [Hyphomonadaceae bacterium]
METEPEFRIFIASDDPEVAKMAQEHPDHLSVDTVSEHRWEGASEAMQLIAGGSAATAYLIGRLVQLLEYRNASFEIRDRDGSVLAAKGRPALRLIKHYEAQQARRDESDETD